MNKYISSLLLSTIIGMSASSCERQVTSQSPHKTTSSEPYPIQESSRVSQPTNPVYNSHQSVSQPSQEQLQSPTPTPTNYLALLHAAKEITVSERSFSFNKRYDIIVDNTTIAKVTGKLVTSFGETFILTTIDGKVLASESESIRVLRWNRQASVKDSAGNITGYFGEERLADFFSIDYIIHFYDKDKKEVGQS